MWHSLNSGVGIECFFHFHWKKLGIHLRTFFVDILIGGQITFVRS